ncbi:outer membrane beta-barrel protein [Solimonas flava]|uniref:outer membrane beta-barrel protein n=1 Tax=Solimonas flava TaxID=415849 RepID=UPI000419BB8E|nr:outer membrane beta-barrel protein [Solimonas flava]
MNYRRYWPVGAALLAAGFIVPAYAQESAAPADESAPVEAAPAEAVADPLATDSGAAGAEATGSETGSEAVETSASEDSGSDETASAPRRESLYVYGGIDYAALSTSLSKDSLKNSLGGDDFDSDFYRLRVGTRLLPSIGIEAQFGIKNEDGKSAGKVETSQMYGLYVVPTGNLFRFLEVSAPIGYSHLRLENSNGKVDFDSLSFGLNLEVPVYVNPDSRWPDVRIGGGGTVFYAEREARTYGYHAGVRLDFKI